MQEPPQPLTYIISPDISVNRNGLPLIKELVGSWASFYTDALLQMP